MKKLSILIVSQYFHPENVRISDLAAELVERGHKVTVLTGIPNYPAGSFFDGYGLFQKRRETWRGVDVIRAPLIARGSSRSWRLALNYVSYAIAACFTGWFRVRRKVDVIFVFQVSPATVGIPALFMKWLKKAPVLFWILDLWPEALEIVRIGRVPAVVWATRNMMRWIYRGCDRVLVQSMAFLPYVARLGAGPDKTRYFPNWGERLFLQAPQSTASANPLPALPAGFRVLFAGNIGEAQDFPAILAAAEIVRKERRDVHWLIVGDGRNLEWVRQQVVARGLQTQVHLLGRHPLEAMPAFYQAADALLVSLRPETAFTLTIPGKIQSYLASGRPLLAMLDGEGSRVVQEAEAGYCCAAGDSNGLAAKVLALAALGRDERDAMGSKGRSYYMQHFDRESLHSRLEAWMQELAAKQDGQGPKGI